METNTGLWLLLYYLTLSIPIPTAIILVLLYYHRAHPSTTNTTRTTAFKTIPECRAIIAASHFPNTRKIKNQLTPHEA
jgi:hypothetical protein